MIGKYRLSASVDSAVMSVAQAAVAAGRAANVSAWVNEALHRQAEHDRRMQALDQFLHAYEAEHGVITEQEIGAASRRSRSRALVIRGDAGAERPRKKRRGSARGR
jgi:hypothetical protein